MGGRIAALTILGVLAVAPAAQAEDFSLQHQHSGVKDASAEGNVTFPDAGGANVSITVTDRAKDGWCAKAWVTSNLPPSTHTTYQVCNVGEQQTYTVALPATARCDVTFVEVQVARIDPSEGNKIEMGDSQRMTNPCPPIAQPAPPPPPPPPPPAAIDAHIKHDWTAYPRWSRNERLKVTGVPAGAAVELRCRGKGCPGKRRTIAVHNGAADVHRVLRGRHLRVGDVLELHVTRADMIGKFMRFKIRRNRTPSSQVLCLPVGATSPGRC
jgi:hypothetical protein